MAFSREALQQALELSQEIQTLAEAEDWQQLAERDERRMQLLRSCLDQGIPEAEQGFARAILQQIQGLNDALRTRLDKERNEVQEALKLLQKRKEASSAYDRCP
ncbi:MAG: flagellar protein FliT [Gammaproteobacteria bacterium SHHR-1]|uniref:flagellar protein FliT n=1 Tax=Magnetovirga frankeli TaxID=947516 RepID=UPI001293A638|nr:flagellar protein FliT [gamma proteobacterium SS-5]